MTLYHYFSSIPLPFVSLLLPFCAAFAIFAARLYHKIIKVKTGEAKTINKKITAKSIATINLNIISF